MLGDVMGGLNLHVECFILFMKYDVSLFYRRQLTVGF